MWTAALRRIGGTVHRAFAVVSARMSGDSGEPSASLFEDLQHVLRLAAACPAGPVGDEIRRGACELVEAPSHAAHRAGRRWLLKVVRRVQLRHARGRSRHDDPTPSMASQLAAALSAGPVAGGPNAPPRPR